MNVQLIKRWIISNLVFLWAFCLWASNANHDQAFPFADAQQTPITGSGGVNDYDFLIPITITLQESGQVDTPRIYLKHIAQCEASRDLCAEILAIDVGQSPQPGRKIMVFKRQIEEILSKEYPGRRLIVKGAERCHVVTTFQVLDRNYVQTFVKDRLEQLLKENPQLRLRSVSVHLSREIKIWPTSFKLNLPILESPRMHNLDWVQRFLVDRHNWIMRYQPDYVDNGDMDIRLTVRVELEVMRPVVVRSLPRGTILTHDMFEYQWQPLDRHSLQAFAHVSDLVGLRLRKNLTVGQMILKRDAEVPQTVKRGQQLNLIVRKGNLTIISQAKALDDGGVGEMIRVYYQAGKKNLQARVLSPTHVEVNL